VNIIAKSTSTYTTADKKVYVAGIVGNYAAASFTNTPEIINSYSKGSVEGESTVNNSTRTSIQQVYVAGVWANNSGKLYNCYASGNLKGKTVTANVNVCGITGYINTGTLTKCYAVMDAIDITTTSGTQVGRRIANGTGTNQIISAYSLANTKVNGSAATLYVTETEPNGLNISSADFITGLNAYVSANPTNNSVNLKTWAAVTASSNDVAKGAVAGVTKIPVLTGQSYSTTLTTTPTTGNHFVNWTLDTSGGAEQSTNASYSFTASANRTLVANFEPNTVPVSSGVTNASTITCTTCDVTVASGAELTVGATQTLKSVTVAAGGKLTLTAGTLSATNGITLESDANGTATMLQSGTLTGTVNAKQYLGSARNWYVSSPVSIAGAPATNMDYYYEYMEGGNNNDFATQPGSSSLYWKGIPNGTTMEVGKGYIAKTNAGTTVQFNGTPNNGDITTTFNLTRDDAKGKGFNLVGNPYPSYIDWTDVATANPNLENTYYYRTKNTNITNTYTFVTWNGAGAGSYVVSNGSLPANTSITRFIPPTQAFWVRVKSNPSSTKMYFNNGMREHRGNDDYNLLKTRKQDARTSIRLQLHNGTESDEMLVYFDANAANTFDSYDSPKMMNNSSITPDLYTKVDAERLVINGLNAISDNMELPLGFSLNSAASLKLKATEMSNFATGIKVYLLDKTDNIQTELLPETEYSFGTNSATLNNESRFSLLFRAPGSTTGIDNASKLNTQVFVNANNQISIIAPEKANYSIYNAVGQLIENGIVNLKYETRNTKLNAGVYVVKLNNQSTRIIIK
jgi:hypothetical protein